MPRSSRGGRSWLMGMLGLALAACRGAAASEPAPALVDRVAAGDQVWDRTLAVGTLIEATICDTAGGPLAAMVSGDVRNARRWVVIPARSAVGLRLLPSRPPGITLGITSVTVADRVYPLSAVARVSGVVGQVSRDVVVVAPGTRILFVLGDGLTVAPRQALSASIVASPFDARVIRLPPRSC
jgi:hypothetical protein